MGMKLLRKPVLIAALLLTGFGLSACVVDRDRDYRGGAQQRHHHWNNDARDWNGAGWQGNGDGWHRRHRR